MIRLSSSTTPFYVMAIIYVTVKVQIEDDLEPMDVIEECDFELSGDGVISAEICRVDDY